MRRTLVAVLGLIVGFLFLGLDISRQPSGAYPSWRVSFVAGAHAQACQFSPNPPTNCNPEFAPGLGKNEGDPCGNGCGDPINFAIGSKYEAETDYASIGPFPLVLTRYYNSLDIDGSTLDTTVVHKFGAKQRGSYDRSIAADAEGDFAYVTRDDGQVLDFAGFDGVWKPNEPDINYTLTATGSGWTLVTDQDETETYDTNGRLLTYANRAGLTQTFSRDGQGRLVTATDPFGRTMTFAFASSSSPLITKVTAPDGGVYSYAYDANSNLTSVTFPDSSQRRYVYENASYPTTVTGVIDENGNRYATFAYNVNGLATSTQHAGGAGLTTVDYTYISDGVVSVTGPLGGVTNYMMVSNSQTAKQGQVLRNCSNCTSSVGGYIFNTYDGNNNLTGTNDFNGNVTTYTYDTTRNLETSRTMASGTSIARTITTSWNPNYRLPAQIVDGTRTLTYSYDANGNLLSATLTASTITSTRSFTYNAGGQVLSATDPRGNVTTYTYDAQGNLTSVTNALGQQTLYTSYDANGRPLSMQDPNGIVTTLSYNFRGQLTSKTTLARVTTYAYDAVGNLSKVTRPDGSFLSMTYDAAHRLIGIADALGDTIAYSLDAAGNRIQTQVFDPSHSLTRTHSQVFDGFSRQYQDIGAASQTSTFDYDGNDNRTDLFNPNSVDTQLTNDALNRVIQVAKSGSLTSFGYDPKSRENMFTDPRGLVTNYTYDGLNDRTSITSPDTGATTKTYDAAGNLATSTDANGYTSTYSYDAVNRRTQWSLSNGTVITYQYDQGTNGIGRITSMTDPSGTTTWGYNRYGQVNLRQQTIGAVTLTTRWVYTANTGLLASITYPSGSTVSFSYNTNGQASGITYQPSGGGPTSTLLSNIVYQPFGPVASWHNGNGTTYSRTYDQDGRVAGLALPGGDTIALTYDANSRITGLTETGLPAKSFAYDGLDRLTSYASGSLTQTYAYDNAGNRTSYTSNTPSVSLTYLYASTSNRLLSVSGSSSETYTYDNNGNITNHQTPAADYIFAYNARDRQNQATVGANVKAYQIDGLGQRVAKVSAGLYQTLFSFDASGHMMGRYNGDGSLLEETVWLGNLPVAVLAPGAQYAVAPDHLGAPHQITDSGGNVVWLWDHDPFGNGTPTGSFGYNLRFPGQFYDQQTGLHYNYFRDYDPAKGRYVESDPIGLAGGTNTYGYVGSNPLGRSDRLGLDPACDHLGKLLKDLSTLLIPIVDKINNIMEVADDVEKITEDIANTPPTVEGAHTVQGLNPETTNGHGSEGQASGPASAGNTGTTPDSFANING